MPKPLIFSLVLSQSRSLSCVLISLGRRYRAKSSVFSTEQSGQLGLVETTEGYSLRRFRFPQFLIPEHYNSIVWWSVSQITFLDKLSDPGWTPVFFLITL